MSVGMLTRTTNKRLVVLGNRCSWTSTVTRVFDRNRESGVYIHRSNANSQSSELLSQNGISLVNKGKNILHKLSLEANRMVISY